MAQLFSVTGRLGEDAEVRNTTNGNKMITFSVADDQSYTNRDGERVKETCWVPVVYFRKPDEKISQFLTKAKEVTVYGKWTQKKVEGENGNRTYYQVKADSVILHGKKDD